MAASTPLDPRLCLTTPPDAPLSIAGSRAQPVFHQLVLQGVAVDSQGAGRGQAMALIFFQGQAQIGFFKILFRQRQTDTHLEHLGDDRLKPVPQMAPPMRDADLTAPVTCLDLSNRRNLGTITHRLGALRPMERTKNAGLAL